MKVGLLRCMYCDAKFYDTFDLDDHQQDCKKGKTRDIQTSNEIPRQVGARIVSELKTQKIKEVQTCGEVTTLTNHNGKKEYAIFEQIFVSQDIGDHLAQFLYYEPTTGRLKMKDVITKNAEETWIPMNGYPFPQINGAKDYETLEELYDRVYEFIYEHADLTDETYYHTATAFILATWRREDFDAVSYLMFLGEFASGKTRMLEILAELCYRPIRTSSISSAALVRLVQKHDATLLIDETDILNAESKGELVGILNSGYKAGDFYIRAKQDSEDLEYWKTFGFKALAGTQDFSKTLNSRCIEVPMEKATRSIRNKLDKVRGLELRMKLLNYRDRNLFKPLDDVQLPFENGRNHELFTPLIQILPQKHRELVIKCGLKQESSRKIEDSVSFEGDVLRALLTVIKNKKSERIKASEIFEEYKIQSDVDSEILNKEQKRIKNRIGRMLKNKFHLEQAWNKAYHIDKEKIARMMQRYTPDLTVDEYLGAVYTLEKSVYSVGSVCPSTNEHTKHTDHTVSIGLRLQYPHYCPDHIFGFGLPYWQTSVYLQGGGGKSCSPTPVSIDPRRSRPCCISSPEKEGSK